jgi:fumarate hydratase class II
MTSQTNRTEHDSLGPLSVPADALWGAQTQRAVENFPISGTPMPASFIQAVARIKAACARANQTLELLSQTKADAIVQAATDIIEGQYLDQFPVDVFQTGSGTSTNMNANEVIAHLASQQSGELIHPNDDVNMSQSSNDVIPTAIHLSAALALETQLLPALAQAQTILQNKARAVQGLVKTGRTHLMDAMPVRLDQELNTWHQQLADNADRLQSVKTRLHQLPQGGTAVGTGINAPADFGRVFCECLNQQCREETALNHLDFSPMPNAFVGLSSQDTALELSGQLNTLAAGLVKIANDLRWMNSGPLAGLGEIQLPALQPGSSIMPGKINPVIPEAVAMVGAQIMGNHTTLTLAGQSGNFQLNVMLPLVATRLLESLNLSANALTTLATKAIEGFQVNEQNLSQTLAVNPILVTALNALVGYETGAAIAKEAYRTGRPVLDVAEEMTSLDRQSLANYLDPEKLTHGGLPEDFHTPKRTSDQT